MTIDQAIHTADELKPNQIERARKIQWLDALDRRIYRDLMCTHRRNDSEEIPDTFGGYDQSTDLDTVLLSPPPYDEIYRYFLEMHIDLVNREFDQYNNSAALFDVFWGRLARMWNREHRPLETESVHLHF